MTTGLVYLYFSIRQNILLWLFGIINAGLYIYIFLISKFYAGAGLQVYYLFICIYGWYNWKYGNNRDTTGELPVSNITRKITRDLFIICLLIFAVLSFILKNYTDSPLPLGDSFTSSLSIIASWMLARKILEHWLLWIVVDSFSMGMYFYRDLYPTAFLYFVFTFMAITGYYQWKRSMIPDKQNI